MGLFGGGNSSSSTSVTTNDYSANPTLQGDLSGSIGGDITQVSPIFQGPNTSVGNITTTSSSFFAPFTNTPSINYGDSAVKYAQSTAQAAQTAYKPVSTAAGSSTSPAWLTALFSAPDIYYLIGGLVILMLFRGHHR